MPHYTYFDQRHLTEFEGRTDSQRCLVYLYSSPSVISCSTDVNMRNVSISVIIPVSSLLTARKTGSAMVKTGFRAWELIARAEGQKRRIRRQESVRLAARYVFDPKRDCMLD